MEGDKLSHLLMTYQMEIFIFIEILSLVVLFTFGIVRYFLNKQKLSTFLIFLFIGLIMIEACLGLIVYLWSGEVSNTLIIITIFVFYACTFGIFDFKNLDRWMRKTIGKWRGIDLLTAKDKEIIKRRKDPAFIARKNRISATIHLVLFVLFQFIFLIYSNTLFDVMDYVQDFSWVGTEDIAQTPYKNETLYGISMVWGIVFIADFLYSWSYTFFPSKPKE